MPNPTTQDQRVNAKRTANALDRIQTIEDVLNGVLPQIDNGLNTLSKQQQNQGEVLEAVVGLLGQESITAAVKTNRDRRATENMENEKRALEELKGTGALASAEKVSDKSLIVGREYDKDGNVLHPGRVQVGYQRVEAQFQPKLLGQPVGTSFELPKGGKFEVVEIYEVVEKPSPEPTTEVPAAEAPAVPATEAK